MGLGSQQLCLHDQASVASALCFGARGLGRDKLLHISHLLLQQHCLAQGREDNAGLSCHENSGDTKHKQRQSTTNACSQHLCMYSWE